MNTLIILSSVVLYASLNQASAFQGPFPGDFQVFPPPIPDRPMTPCGPMWDCKNNCTKEKKALQLCCSNNNIPSGTKTKDFCGFKCSSFEHTYKRCLETCKPKPKSCPTGNDLPKEFCKKSCSHGRFSDKESDQCPFTMSMVTPLCRPYCQYDNHCPVDQKCCPTACSFSCQKPV